MLVYNITTSNSKLLIIVSQQGAIADIFEEYNILSLYTTHYTFVMSLILYSKTALPYDSYSNGTNSKKWEVCLKI